MLEKKLEPLSEKKILKIMSNRLVKKRHFKVVVVDHLLKKKNDESSSEQSDEKKNNSENNREQLGKEKNGENSCDKSSEEEKDDESNGKESSKNEKSGESESEQSSEKQKEDRSNQVKKEKKIEPMILVVMIFQKIMPYESKINARVGFEAQFVEFRKILRSQHIENDFKNPCFDHFLKLDENVAIHLPMKLVHGDCLRRIFCEKQKEIWFDYNGLPICFGIKKFAIVTGLQFHSLPPLSQQLAKIGKEGEKLVDIVSKCRCIHREDDRFKVDKKAKGGF
ncbi:hypothetical protein P3L10_016238 [Capsicum annuum]